MKITYLGIFFGLLLLACPIAIIIRLRLNVLRRVLLSFGRMAVATGVLSATTGLAIYFNNVWVSILIALLLCLCTVLITVSKARLNISKLFIPVAAGTVVGVGVVGAYTLFLVFGFHLPYAPYNPHLLMPVLGCIMGGMVSVNAKALNVYYSGLKNHGQLYYYLLGNGKSHREAVSWFVKRSLQAALTNVSKQISAVGLLTAPFVFFTAIMCELDVVTALAMQILVFIAIMSASMISILVAVLVGRRYSFDEYECLKPVFKSSKASRTNDTKPTDEEWANETKASDSLSNPSTLPDTDFVSQPQE